MKALIAAHPDDEIIWFSPQDFDLIVIAFLARHPLTKISRVFILKKNSKVTLKLMCLVLAL